MDNNAQNRAQGDLCIVTADGPEHMYVANTIAARFNVSGIFVCDPPPRRKWHRVLRKNPLQFLNKAAWRIYLKLISDSKDRSTVLKDVLGPFAEKFPDVPIQRVGRPKAGQLEAALQSIGPDILAIYGTGIIPDSVLAQANTVALNMHTGISPEYRGTSCAFWPIHNNDPDYVGATVHECTSDVDGGKIYEINKATVFQGDTLHHVFARAVEAGATSYCNVIHAAQTGKLAGEAQDLTTGREYLGSDRGIFSEIKARWRLAKMQQTLPSSPK